jgi:uncharacterized protein (DUF952 family)
VSVIFHLAAREDWERASRDGVYTAASLYGDGFVGCATATQHAAVAGARFAGRGDLVLLLIDTDKLTSPLRFEQTGAGEAFPHVFGPVDLDAVFEAAPYRPGPNGRFGPHEEASGLATRGAATLEETTRQAAAVMAGFDGSWWVAGGWALDLFLGYKTRPHADLELSVMAADQQALFAHLRGRDLRLAAPGASLPVWDGTTIRAPFHQVWARRGPGRPASPDEFAADPTMVGFLLEQGTGAAGCSGGILRSRGRWSRSGRGPATASGTSSRGRAAVQGQGTTV